MARNERWHSRKCFWTSSTFFDKILQQVVLMSSLIFQSAFISWIKLSINAISVIASRYWLQGLYSYTKYDTLMRLWNSRLIVESISAETDLLNSCSPLIQDKFPALIAYQFVWNFLVVCHLINFRDSLWFDIYFINHGIASFFYLKKTFS